VHRFERRLALALLAIAASGCFAGNRQQAGGSLDPHAAGGPGMVAGSASGASAPAAGASASGDAPFPAVEPCDAECACDGGRFIGVWVCNDDGSAVCSCDDAMTRGEACTPGVRVSCTCTDGRRGSQACSEDGRSFGDCTCDG
jgi:hypothetical protein